MFQVGAEVELRADAEYGALEWWRYNVGTPTSTIIEMRNAAASLGLPGVYTNRVWINPRHMTRIGPPRTVRALSMMIVRELTK
jgi:hypothetical protein